MKSPSKKKGPAKKWILSFIFLMLIFMITNPDQEDYYTWLDREYGISLDQYNYVDGTSFEKDGQQIYEVGHTRNALFFTQREMKYYSMDGEQLLFETKTVGLLGTFIVMK